jgi:hypothetical protein
VGWFFGTRQQAAGGVQDLPDRSTGAGQEDLCYLQFWVTGKVVEQSPRARNPLQVLWRRKTHLHNPLDDPLIPAEVGGMMGPRTRKQHGVIMGITFRESLAPFLDPTYRASRGEA